MNATQDMKKKWGYDRYRRFLIKAKNEAGPYWSKFSSEEGMDALNVFYLQAHLVILGTDSKSNLVVTSKMISESLDIPENVFDCLYDSIEAFLSALNFDPTAEGL